MYTIIAHQEVEFRCKLKEGPNDLISFSLLLMQAHHTDTNNSQLNVQSRRAPESYVVSSPFLSLSLSEGMAAVVVVVVS